MSKTLLKIRNTIVENYNPNKIILFGSRAWGKPHKWSDYDLFILKNGARKQMHKRRGDILRLMRKHAVRQPIDVFVYNKEELRDVISGGNQLFRHIVQKGKTIYEKI